MPGLPCHFKAGLARESSVCIAFCMARSSKMLSGVIFACLLLNHCMQVLPLVH